HYCRSPRCSTAAPILPLSQRPTCAPTTTPLFFPRPVAHPALHSFPTRRSSDLLVQWNPVSRGAAPEVSTARKIPAGSTQSTASRSSICSRDHPPCSWCPASAASLPRRYSAPASRPGQRAPPSAAASARVPVSIPPAGAISSSAGPSAPRRRIMSSSRVRTIPAPSASPCAAGRSPWAHTAAPGSLSSTARTSSVPMPRRRSPGTTTSSAGAPSPAPRAAHTLPSRRRRRARAGAPPRRGRPPCAPAAAAPRGGPRRPPRGRPRRPTRRPPRPARPPRPRRPSCVPSCFPGVRGSDRLVPDVTDGPDQRLVIGAEFGPQPTHVHVDGAGGTEVVVPAPPLEEPGARQRPAGVPALVLEQLDLLVGQAARPPPDPGHIGLLVDPQLTHDDHAALAVPRRGVPGREKPEPRVDLRRAGAGQDDVVEPPVPGDRDQPALREHTDHGWPGAAGQHPAQGPGRDQLAAGIDDGDRGTGESGDRGGGGREQPDGVREQRQRRED